MLHNIYINLRKFGPLLSFMWNKLLEMSYTIRAEVIFVFSWCYAATLVTFTSRSGKRSYWFFISELVFCTNLWPRCSAVTIQWATVKTGFHIFIPKGRQKLVWHFYNLRQMQKLDWLHKELKRFFVNCVQRCLRCSWLWPLSCSRSGVAKGII